MEITHGNLENLIAWHQETFDVKALAIGPVRLQGWGLMRRAGKSGRI